MKKPAIFNGVFIRTDTHRRRSFTKDGAQREANRLAKRYGKFDAMGVVTDATTHWVIDIRDREPEGV